MSTPAQYDHAGVVEKLVGDDAVIRFARGKMCGHCKACIASGPEAMDLTLPNTLHANVGDRVTVMLEGRKIVTASILAYAIPLAALLAGVFVGSRVSDVVAIGLGITFCAIAVALISGLNHKFAREKTFQPRMTAIIGREETDRGELIGPSGNEGEL